MKKTRSVKSKWQPDPSNEAFIRTLERLLETVIERLNRRYEGCSAQFLDPLLKSQGEASHAGAVSTKTPGLFRIIRKRGRRRVFFDEARYEIFPRGLVDSLDVILRSRSAQITELKNQLQKFIRIPV